MHINAPRDSDIQYNATQGSFEARILVRDTSGVYAYAAQVTACLMAEPRMIKAALIDAAQKMHLAPRKGLHMHQITPNSDHLTALAA